MEKKIQPKQFVNVKAIARPQTGAATDGGVYVNESAFLKYIRNKKQKNV
jgi:hypothetical protein